MKRIHIYLMFITLVSAANTCTCGINKVGPTFYFSKEFKDYTLFNEGSKWIYQLENSQTLDTMITIYRNVEVKQPNGEDRNYELTLTRDTSSYYEEIIIQFGHVAEFGQQFDNSQGTDTQYRALCWEGLHLTAKGKRAIKQYIDGGLDIIDVLDNFLISRKDINPCN